MNKKTYTNKYLKVNIFTNSKNILKLVDNFLDFNERCTSGDKVKTNFYFNETNLKDRHRKDNLLLQSWCDKDNNLLYSAGKRMLTVEVNPRAGRVKAAISRLEEAHKTRLLGLIFLKPLRLILAHHGLFFLHASAVCKDRGSIIIAGEEDAGKSIVALLLSRAGFDILTDDKLFIKSEGDRTKLFPFPTKMGLNDKILNRYPRLNKYIIKNYRYGKKRRLSLNHLPSNTNATGEPRCRMVIFPSYKTNSHLHAKAISKKEALNRLAKNILNEFSNIGFKKAFSDNFWTLYNLVRQTRTIELVYNDDGLEEIPELINKQFAALN